MAATASTVNSSPSMVSFTARHPRRVPTTRSHVFAAFRKRSRAAFADAPNSPFGSLRTKMMSTSFSFGAVWTFRAYEPARSAPVEQVTRALLDRGGALRVDVLRAVGLFLGYADLLLVLLEGLLHGGDAHVCPPRRIQCGAPPRRHLLKSRSAPPGR